MTLYSLEQFWMGNPKMILMQPNFYYINTNLFVCTNIDPYGSMLANWSEVFFSNSDSIWLTKFLQRTGL